MIDVEAAVHDYLRREVLVPQGRDADELGPDVSLFRTGIVDSFGLLELINHLERTFGIAVRDEDVVPENFDTLKAIARFVRARCDAPAAGA